MFSRLDFLRLVTVNGGNKSRVRGQLSLCAEEKMRALVRRVFER